LGLDWVGCFLSDHDDQTGAKKMGKEKAAVALLPTISVGGLLVISVIFSGPKAIC